MRPIITEIWLHFVAIVWEDATTDLQLRSCHVSILFGESEADPCISYFDGNLWGFEVLITRGRSRSFRREGSKVLTKRKHRDSIEAASNHGRACGVSGKPWPKVSQIAASATSHALLQGGGILIPTVPHPCLKMAFSRLSSFVFFFLPRAWRV